MENQRLASEIKETSIRIEARQLEIDGEIKNLIINIDTYTSWAWKFVWLGAILAVISTILFFCKNTDTGFGLNLLGDFMSGTVASIWSLAGLFFIYVAFLGQKQQLLNQQLEIMFSQLEVKYTRLELAGQKVEMMEQNKTLGQQRFENTFFQLLTLFNSIVNSIDLTKSKFDKEIISTGRDCFETFYTKLLNTFMVERMRKDNKYVLAHISKDIDSYKKLADIDISLLSYDDLYDRYKSDMGHYFRTLYHIIKFIDQSDLEDKKRYVAIIRAQLSSYEQILLFYNCLHEHGVEKFKPMIEKYALFKNIDRTLVINQSHLEEYDDSAYGL